jgi:hypothetical protein
MTKAEKRQRRPRLALIRVINEGHARTPEVPIELLRAVQEPTMDALFRVSGKMNAQNVASTSEGLGQDECTGCGQYSVGNQHTQTSEQSDCAPFVQRSHPGRTSLLPGGGSTSEARAAVDAAPVTGCRLVLRVHCSR